jgi:serine/threonine protein kinase
VPDADFARLTAEIGERYAISGEIGRGGMATVYLAHDLKHSRQVAIKVLRRELYSLTFAERFLAEIQVTAGLQHPYILPLFDSGAVDTLLYYVMPFVDGQTLRIDPVASKAVASVLFGPRPTTLHTHDRRPAFHPPALTRLGIPDRA